MAIEYSMPKWIIDHWATHYGLEETETILQSFLENDINNCACQPDASIIR